MTGNKFVHVVDLGCGNGDTLARFCKYGVSMTGVDFSAIALNEAKNKFFSYGDKVVLIEADLENLKNSNIKTPPATLWLCKLVLAFIYDREKFLKYVRDKMAIGDVFFILTPVLHDKIVYQKEDKPSIAIRQNEIDDLLLSIFDNKITFSNEYPGERGHIVSYLIKS